MVRYYSPYPTMSDMNGMFALGTGAVRFVPPRRIPDPRTSDKSAREFMAIWIAWASAREQTLSDWAMHIDNLISNSAASCQSIVEYNAAAIAHFHVETDMAVRFIKAGLEVGDSAAEGLAVPLFPALYGSQIDVRDVPGAPGRVSIHPILPACGRGTSGFPDFSRLRIFGPPAGIEGSKTPHGTGLGVVPAIGWAAVALTVAIFGGTALLMHIAFKGMSDRELFDADRAMRGQGLENRASRAGTNDSCVQDALDAAKAAGKTLSLEENLNLRRECAAWALAIHPDLEHLKPPSGLGRGLLLGGLGIAAVIGAFAYFKGQKQEE